MTQNLSFCLVPSHAPQTVKIQLITSRSFRVYWRPLDQQYVKGILNAYKVQCVNMSDQRESTLSVSPKRVSAQVRNLKNFTKYQVSVCACTSQDCGKCSPPWTVQTFWDSKYMNRHSKRNLFLYFFSALSLCLIPLLYAYVSIYFLSY